MKSWLGAVRQKRNDARLGKFLISLGFLSGWGIALFFIISREPIPFSMLTASGGLIFTGFVLIFSDGIEKSLGIEDELQTFSELVQDDLEDLKCGRVTPTLAMVAITLLSLIGQIAFVFLYRKWQATWMGCLNVVFAAVLAGFGIGFIGLGTRWFQDRRQRFSWWVFLLPLLFFALSAFLGIYYAEPQIRAVRDLPVNQNASYQYEASSSRINQMDGQGTFYILDGAMELDCDDEACLVLILVVIGIACIAASAFIPHFWVVATTILWVIMLLITTRELLCTRDIPYREG
jgi:hypothetical protein